MGSRTHLRRPFSPDGIFGGLCVYLEHLPFGTGSHNGEVGWLKKRKDFEANTAPLALVNSIKNVFLEAISSHLNYSDRHSPAQN